MRDILTVVASIIILVLAAAVAAPPLMDWEGRRELIDQTISRASGIEAHTEGRIAVRLLPSPRLRVDRLRLGSGAPEAPSLVADYIWAEVELMPLLRGEVRFTETRIGRADLHIPVAKDGTFAPPYVFSGLRGRELAVENLKISQLLVTTQRPDTGRTDQIFADNVTVEGQKLTGPWRVEGTTRGIPFRLVTAELGEDKTVQVKLAGGGDHHPRFDIDAKLALGADTASLAAGKAKILFGPPAQVAAAGIPIPIILETGFKTKQGRIALDNTSLEAGEGGASLRMIGQGEIQLSDPRISLKLEGRRLDADSFIISSNGRDFKSRIAAWSLPANTLPIDLDLKLDSIGLGQEDLSSAVLRASLIGGQVKLERFEFMAPGETRVTVQGETDLSGQIGLEGRVAITSNVSDRLARYLERIDIRSPFLKALDGRPVEVASDISFASPILSLSRMRVKAGDTVLSGNVRFAAPEAGQRGRLEAQLALQDLNLDQLPQLSSVFDATQNVDVGFTLDARNVRAGNRPGAGRISARVLSDGKALVVETLDIVDLAGANARVNGRIDPNGSGRIAGKVTAQRAAPLLDILGSVWVGGISQLTPPFVREGDVNLDVVTERIAPPAGSTAFHLRTTARGTVAGGRFDGKVESADGKTENLDVLLATDNTGLWLGQGDAPSLKRPSSITMRGARVASGRFNVTLSGDVGGLTVTTKRPFALSAADDVVDSGEVEVQSADILPFLRLMGDSSGIVSPVPASGRMVLGRERDATLIDISGTVASEPVQARLTARARSEINGEISLQRLSLPWLANVLSLNAAGDPNTLWSTVGFGPSARLMTGGQVTVKTATLDLGRGIQATKASFNLSAMLDGIAINNLDAGLGDGRLTGSASISRQGALASIVGEGALRDVSLQAFAGTTPLEGRLSGSLKFGTSAQNIAGLVANLGGAGDWRIANLKIPGADPTALDRALKRALAESDPLAAGRVDAILGEELSRAPLAAASVTTSAALVGGVLRLSPFVVESQRANWQGAVTYDFRTMTFDARGALTAKAAPQGWTGAPPSTGLAWKGTLGAPVREVDSGSFRNGLAAVVLKRELEKIEAFEKAAAERQRQLQQQEAERQRAKAAAEEAARQVKAREDAERAQRQQEQPADASPPQAGGSSPFTMPALTPTIDLKPPPVVRGAPGG
ncbi:AsmA-like C-terminal region-containing protein [Microvirga flavescens]|uniref:AsmA family protein n=1 Tax=Microvirga flavescens TaxID=2249811 RepID=UPI000DD9D867|nr:AsmA-like C-terminal region-containing protein [Microvirga flavescens]